MLFTAYSTGDVFVVGFCESFNNDICCVVILIVKIRIWIIVDDLALMVNLCLILGTVGLL